MISLGSKAISYSIRPLIFLTTIILGTVNPQDTRPTLAVIDFEGRGISQLEAQTLTDRFRSSISNTGVVRLVERSMMEEILQEQGLQQTGCTTNECVVEAGKLLGVEYMVGGAIGKVGDTFTIDTRMISVETGESVRTRNVTYVGKVDGLIVEIEILAYELMEMKPPVAVLERRSELPTGIDQRVPRVKTRMGAMMRSLVFPGFGQFYAERRLWGYGWILSELAVAGLIYTSYNTYQSAYDDYNRFMDLYGQETDVLRIAEHKAKARESHDHMDSANEQIRMLTGVAGGLWVANVLHALIMGPRRQPGNVYKEPALKLVYDPNTRMTQLEWRIALH